MTKLSSADRPQRAAEMEAKEAADRVGQVLRRAFPLPESGAFSDLLAALEAAREISR